jgi:hypothetical protein
MEYGKKGKREECEMKAMEKKIKDNGKKKKRVEKGEK